MSTEFNYVRAHKEWAEPEFVKLPGVIFELLAEVGRLCAGQQQNASLGMDWPEGLKEKFDAVDPDLLGHAARVIYAHGHWHPRSSRAYPAGAHWKFERFAQQSLADRGVSYARYKDAGDQFMDHKEGTDYDNDELPALINDGLLGRVRCLKVANVNFRVKGHPSDDGHPFMITQRHLRESSIYLDPGCAPCGICGHPYELHVSDKVAVLAVSGVGAGDKLELTEEERGALQGLEPFLKQNKVDGFVFTAEVS